MSLVRTATGERLSSVVLTPMPAKVDRRLFDKTRPQRIVPLAAPPAGSGLKPVPGDAGPPVIGHTLSYIRYGSAFTRARHAALGPVSWCGFVGEHVVIAAGPDATHEVLTNPDKAYSQDGWRFLVDDFFHRGLMLLDGDDHRVHRRVMQEAFTAPRIRGYVDRTVPVLREAIPSWPRGQQIRIYPMLKSLTLDVATHVFMDDRSGPESDAVNQAFMDCVQAASSIVRRDLPGTRYRAGLRGRALLERYFRAALPAKRAGHGDDLFSVLCRATTPEGEAFSDDDVVNHMIFLMMAAHDTSTITSAAAAYYLAAHLEWQERAREESLALDSMTGAPPDLAALQSLTTLDLVIKESLRLAAPVPVVMRRTVKDTALLGHHVPAGQLVMAAGATNHHDPAVWTAPDVFDPERFAEPRREDKAHRDAWIPFGGGVHKCLGMLFGSLEVTAILHELLRNHRITVAPGYRPRWDNTSLPVPADGLPLRLEPLR